MKKMSSLTVFIRSITVWSSFAALAFWGHATKWTFVSLPGKTSLPEQSLRPVSPKLNLTSGGRDSKQGLISWDNAEDLRKSGIEFSTVSQTVLEETISALASVTYNGQRLAQLSSRASGHVWQVYVRPGQHVKQGEVLAIVDSQEVGEAKSDWMQKRFAAIHMRRTYERLSRVGQGALPEQRVLTAEMDVRQADLDSYMAQQRLINLGLHVPEIDDPELPLGIVSDRLRFLDIPSSLLASLDPKPTTANLISILAPFEGTVVEQRGVVGEVVNPEQVLFVVADTRTMWLKISIRREDAPRLALGQHVTFIATGMNQPITTKIAWISSEIDAETRTVQAGCEVENKATQTSLDALLDMSLRANQFGSAKVVVKEHLDAFSVPESALQRMPDAQEVLFVRHPGPATFEPRVVKTGVRVNGQVQILEGVTAGEEVVNKGSFILKSELMKASLVGG